MALISILSSNEFFPTLIKIQKSSVADTGGRGPREPCPPVIKKMAAEGACIDFMFLGPPYQAAGSATEVGRKHVTKVRN